MACLTLNRSRPSMHVAVRFEQTNRKVRMAIRSLSIAIILVLVAVSGAAAANGAKKIKVGKTGAITLKAPTNIGAFTLPPGRYLVQHRVVGSDHRIHFTLLKENLSPWAPWRSKLPSGGDAPKSAPNDCIHEAGGRFSADHQD